MSKFFLHNGSINVANFDSFKLGIFNLIAISQAEGHVFYKHESIYTLQIIVNELFTSIAGQKEQEVYRFIEQLSPCELLIDSEAKANNYCNSDINGFLGIDFAGTGIPALKQITNDLSYRAYCLSAFCNLEHFLEKTTIPPDKKKVHLSSHHGKKELTALSKRIRNSPYVIEMQSTAFGGKEFIRAISDDGIIEIVLWKSKQEYALRVKTTAKNPNETLAIAKILEHKYDN
jgi:hypothetical protein